MSCSPAFVMFISAKEKTPEKFSPEDIPFCSETCVFNNFLGVTKMILWLPQYLLE